MEPLTTTAERAPPSSIRLRANISPVDFRQTWERIAQLAGRPFRLSTGGAFQYAFKKTFVVIEPGRQSIPKTNFQKIFDRGDAAQVQGQKHIRSILADPRITETSENQSTS